MSRRTFSLFSILSLVITLIAQAFFSFSAQAAPISVGTNEVQFINANDVGSSAVVGNTFTYTNVLPSSGQNIDAVLKVKEISGATITKVDAVGNNQGSPDSQLNSTINVTASSGYVTYTISFIDHVTQEVVTLQNVSINVSDIDLKQFAQFAGPRSYKVQNPTNLTVYSRTAGTGILADSNLRVGEYKFAEISDASSNATDTPHWAEVNYDQISSIDIRIGANKSGGALFGIQFKPAAWGSTATTNPTLAASSYTISYDANTAASGSAPGSTTGTGTLNLAYNTGNMAKPGYAFGGWNTQADGLGATVAPGASFTPTSDITLYAVWLQGAYEVTYDSQGGSSVPSSTFLTNGSFTLRPGSTWAGHTFLGWFAGPNGGTALTSPYSPGVTSNITLYAQWSTNLITQVITYAQPSNGNLSDGSQTVSPTADSGLPVTLTSSTPSVCTVTGFGITYVSAGTCTTVASQAGDSTYSAATSVTRSFTIAPANLTAQTITLPNPGAQNLTSNSVTLYPSATSGLTVVLTSSTPSVCTVTGNVVTFVGPGTCTIVGYQAGNGTYSAAPAVTISFLVTGTSTPTVITPSSTTPTTRFIRPVTPITPVTPKATPTVKPSASPSATTAPATAVAPAASTGQRSVGEIASESIGGFKPGAGLRIEVTGSRISGQFVVSPASIADPVALATAIEESTARTKSNFAQVNSVVPALSAPQSSQIFDTPITTKVSEVFAASGLDKPRTVGDLKPSTKQKWLSVDASVNSYVPGSTVYLVVTTQPTILAAATVGKDGVASLEGLLPVDLLDAGGHNIRLVGTRLIDGVSADNAGNITLDDSAITEIKKFDEGTKATVALYGKSSTGSTMSAVREVYLDKFVAWWTVWLAAGIALLALFIRFLRRPAGFRRRMTTGIIAFAGGIPAFIIGWVTASYELWIGTGIGLAVAAIVLFWGRLGSKLNRMND